MTFPWLSVTTVIFHDFPAWKIAFLNFTTFDGFPWCVRTVNTSRQYGTSTTGLLQRQQVTTGHHSSQRVEKVNMVVRRSSCIKRHVINSYTNFKNPTRPTVRSWVKWWTEYDRCYWQHGLWTLRRITRPVSEGSILPRFYAVRTCRAEIK